MNYHKTLETIVANALVNINNIPDSILATQPAPDKWSKKQILGHLVDSAINNYRRITLANLKEDLLFEGYDQAEWVRLNNYQSREVKEILELWATLNIHMARLIAKIPAEKLLLKTVNHNFDKISMIRLESGEPSSLAYLIWDYIYHVEHHLAQIIDDYEKVNGDFMS